MATPYGQKISGWITDVMSDGIATQDDLDGMSLIRDKKAFGSQPFKKGQYVDIHIQQVLDQNYYQSLVNHPIKAWQLKNGVMFAGVINTIGSNAFDLKEIDPKESPFKSLFFLAERSWIQNGKYIDDLPTKVGDVITVEVRILR